MPALPSSVLEPLWIQFAALLPTRQDTHRLGCHRRRIPDRIIFDKLIQVLVFGCGYRRIADHVLGGVAAVEQGEQLDGAAQHEVGELGKHRATFGLLGGNA